MAGAYVSIADYLLLVAVLDCVDVEVLSPGGRSTR
jgi:hypothetical protein